MTGPAALLLLAAQAQTAKKPATAKAKAQKATAASKSKMAKEKAEKERLEKERLEQERIEAERRAEEERVAREREEAARQERERLERERQEKERIERERREAEERERQRIERERQERIDAGRTEVSRRAGLDDNQGQQVKAINQEFHAKAKAIRENSALDEESKKDELADLNEERLDRIKEAVGGSKSKKLEKERKAYRLTQKEDTDEEWLDDIEGYKKSRKKKDKGE